MLTQVCTLGKKSPSSLGLVQWLIVFIYIYSLNLPRGEGKHFPRKMIHQSLYNDRYWWRSMSKKPLDLAMEKLVVASTRKQLLTQKCSAFIENFDVLHNPKT